jgi:hypothetical protein
MEQPDAARPAARACRAASGPHHPARRSQIVKLEEIGSKVPAEPVIKLEAQGSDPIGAIIDKMQ